MPQDAASFGRPYRLLNGAQYRQVFSRRQSVHGKYFSVHVAGNSLGHARLGMTVSRKVSKRAVQRNRIKRQMRESFRLNRSEMRSIDLVTVAKPGCATQNNDVLRNELDQLWSRAGEKCREY